MGVTVVTLHQGTPGVVNGSLINPWINYPFLDDTVPLLTNYSAQANALGMGVKMYYTIRELSARAVEMFAFKAMQGEILVDEDPYTIVQPGYAHAWNTHGGAAYLHQHMVTHCTFLRARAPPLKIPSAPWPHSHPQHCTQNHAHNQTARAGSKRSPMVSGTRPCAAAACRGCLTTTWRACTGPLCSLRI